MYENTLQYVSINLFITILAGSAASRLPRGPRLGAPLLRVHVDNKHAVML